MPTTVPEVVPARVLLAQPVTVQVTGTVGDSVRALVAQCPMDWLLSIRGDVEPAAHEFEVKDLPLWQAMDRLLEVYGYDWGVESEVLLCWPERKPTRPRTVPVEPPAAAPTAERQEKPIVLQEATPVGQVVEAARVSGVWASDLLGDTCWYVSDQLAPWGLMGKLTAPLALKLMPSVCAVTGAYMDGCGPFGVVVPGALAKLDAAIRLADATASEVRGDPEIAFRWHLLPELGAQQWSLLRTNGVAEVAFRELSDPLAALFVAATRQAERLGATDIAPVDWTQPYRMRVEVVCGGGAPATATTPVIWPRLTVSCIVPETNGNLLRF